MPEQTTDDKVFRVEIEALLSTLTDGRRPAWARNPRTQAQFFASLLHLMPELVPIYDSSGELLAIKGVRLRKEWAARLN